MIEAIEKRVEFDVEPERVWRALTEGAELSRWFPDKADDMAAESEGALFWESHGSFAFRVEAFEPPTFLAWRWVRKPGDEIDGSYTTLVEMRLAPRDGGGTVLDLRESGFEREKDRQDNDGGWDHELGELSEYLAA